MAQPPCDPRQGQDENGDPDRFVQLKQGEDRRSFRRARKPPAEDDLKSDRQGDEPVQTDGDRGVALLLSFHAVTVGQQVRPRRRNLGLAPHSS